MKKTAGRIIESAMSYKVAAFYRFLSLENLPDHQTALKEFCLARGIFGTTLLAPEGVNGTMAGTDDSIDALVDYLDQGFSIRQGEVKFSRAKDMPFERVKIKVKREIITMKQPEAADPTKRVGTYVSPQEWDRLVNDPEVVLLDTRNTYETELGIFKNAIDPKIETFKEFPEFVAKNLDPAKHKKVAMFCTGGIRCEKASAYMLSQGFETVYHLKGGILKYLEEIPEEKSSWDGACFVFDERIALKHGLEEVDDAVSSHGY